MVLDLDEAVEAQLTERANERGVDPTAFAAELLRESLLREAEKRTARREAIEAMEEERKGRKLGLKEMGLTMREFMHLDHKY
ncbi:MAG: hypothetical protein M3R43_05965 [Acidobacteriota bacterium]|nr:hypothetical protein [Acidobacteriota bacterium]